ncbi:hypothetical protein [Coraliomargarita akajimensis]|uniref:Uncharacterized protein n=1 Tax=Coraliomargarita akajimensis (strain DSM 45221 / IAM 15411 / JCM 23193 / KCTC 12865 / 04OKA010-24) TaxID=583355 RepID=D5EIK9_CORAD|nr:hypothetical protein [Coraliomargarita akajimensis]ADE54275.1 hypothetical protein Caka_1255 [Coraliomargarita akajimensis DSM 45221]
MSKPLIALLVTSLVLLSSWILLREQVIPANESITTHPAKTNQSVAAAARAPTASSPTTLQAQQYTELEQQILQLIHSPRPDGELQWDQLETAIRQALSINCAQTLSLLASLEQTGMNHYLIRGYIVEHFEADGDWDEALSLLPTVQPSATLATPLFGELIERKAEESPNAALNWVQQHAELHGSENAAYLLGRAMGSAETPNDYLSGIHNKSIPSTLRANLLKGLAIEWIRQDFDSAVEYFSQAPVGPEYDGAIYEVIGEIRQHDGANTLSWAMLIQDPGLRRSAIIEAAHSWKAQDQIQYAAWKAQTDLPTDIQGDLP